jgi:hypothetical protein
MEPETENKFEVSLPSHFWDGVNEDLEAEMPEGMTGNSTVRSALRHINITRQEVEQLQDAIKKNFADPYNTVPAAKIKSREYGQTIFKDFEKRSDSVLSSLHNQEREIDEKINRPISEEATGPYADSIRNHIKSLPETKRVTFISNLIKDENWVAVFAAFHTKH